MQNPISLTVNYVKSSIAELKKVTWPTREQTVRYSVLVITVSVVIAVFFASLDFGFSRGILFAISKSPHSSAPAAANETPPVTPDLVPTPQAQPSTPAPANSQGLPITITPTPSTNQQPSTNAPAPAPTPTPTPQLPTKNPIQLPK